MAEYFAVPAENLIDTHVADDLRPQDGALMEPLGCVVKSTHLTWKREGPHYAVVGLGSLGIMHLLVLKALFNRYMVEQVVGVEISDKRRQWASDLGLKVVSPKEADKFDVVVLCPGTQMALDTAFDIVYPGGSIILFAPFAPDSPPVLNWDRLYFQEISLSPSYSCGAWECSQALRFLREGIVKAEQVVSHFIGIDELPEAYLAMKRGEILKAMVMFD
jgi:L-iditol 2-dehydrogenase